MANSFKFGGVDLSGSSYGLTIQDGKVPFFGNPKLKFTPYAQAHGGQVSGSKFQALRLVVPVVVVGNASGDPPDHFADLRAKRDALRGVLAPSLGDQPIIFDYEPEKQIYGRLERGFDAVLKGGRAIETELIFLCSDPLWYAVTPSQVINYDGTETIAYTGSAPAPLVITGYADYAAIGAELSAENTTTGDKVATDYPLGAYHYVKFDGEREVLEVSTDGSTWVNAMTSLSETDFSFPTLEPGSNSLVFVGFTNVLSSAYTWTIDWTNRYL